MWWLRPKVGNGFQQVPRAIDCAQLWGESVKPPDRQGEGDNWRPQAPLCPLDSLISQMQEETGCLDFCLASFRSAGMWPSVMLKEKNWEGVGCLASSLPEGTYLGELGRPWGHPQGSFKAVAQ